MHTNNKHDRRHFLKLALAGASVLSASVYASCNRSSSKFGHITGGIVGPDAATGHLLREPGKLPAPTKEIATDILIIGGGISGMSAKQWLQKNGCNNVLLVEMADHYGGNAHCGNNRVSAYPWGAHYLPVPDLRRTELLEFLREAGVITGFDAAGLPVYNEYHICHDPEERLYINGIWQEGVIPASGLGNADKQQIKDFLELMARYKSAVGSDGKDAFCIPLDLASADEEFRALDKIPFTTFLAERGFTSPYLLWYLDYCCKDDYGLALKATSAWAGVHYFAGRKGKGSNATDSTVLTWPEGNGFLSRHLQRQVADGMHGSQLVYKVELKNGGAAVAIYDVRAKTSYTVVAKKVIICSPQFVNKHLIQDLIPQKERGLRDVFHYTPWVIANITVKSLPNKRGMPLCWDNVLYGTASVGYVNANHQDLQSTPIRNVLTYYLPLSGGLPGEERKKARDKTYEDWLTTIIEELEYAHPDIAAYIENVDIWIWGHGMIGPTPGFIWGQERRLAAAPIDNTIFFAHSDLSGVSIFEEAFYQGIKAAKQVMATV